MRIGMIAALLLISASAVFASGKEKKEAPAIPYLGPGADKLPADEYERIYKNYIQTSILLGYPFLKEKAAPCEQALGVFFRSAGMFGYPVPAEAQQVQRAVKTTGAFKVETYEMGGIILQVARNAKSGGLEKLVVIHSASTKASRRLSGLARKELLDLEKDSITGLERVKGIPVGYPHPYLTEDGQGLFVKVLRFNGKTEGCQPLDFLDNAWVGGYDLSEARCAALQIDAEKVWSENLSPDEFAQHELKRMRETALKTALAKGTSESEAKALIEKHFVLPLTNEINIVGSAMRNLAQCNLLALGRAGKTKPEAKSLKERSGGGENGGSAGSAQ